MQRGFSLVETIIATGLLVAALVSLAQLVAMGVQIGVAARARTASVLLAGAKMEELRALAWGQVRANASEAVEYFDAQGVRVCVDLPIPCATARYVCRWTAQPASFNSRVVFVEVTVEPLGAPVNSATFITARSRKSP